MINPSQSLRRLLPAQLLASVALVGLCALAPAPSEAQQQVTDPTRVERIHNSLKPNPNAAAAHANRIIQMEIPNPDGGYANVTLNYNYSIDLAVFYEFDSHELTPETKALLTDLGLALRKPELSGLTFLIAGHTDAKGSKPYNQQLSERRAVEARRFLVEAFGILPSRLFAVGFGEERLADTQRPLDGINRRVEITLIEDVAYQSPTSGVVAPGQVVVVPNQGVVECHTAGGLADPRPAHTGLDDFGGVRTELPCAQQPTVQNGGTIVLPLQQPGAASTNNAINN